MFQTKKQDKTAEKELNEIELSCLLDRVQSNSYKDAHQTLQTSG